MLSASFPIMFVGIYVKASYLLFTYVSMVTPVQGHSTVLHSDVMQGVQNSDEEMQVSYVHGSRVIKRAVKNEDLENLRIRPDENATNDPWKLLSDSPPEDPRFWPTVGNGHVATVAYSDTVFMNGLYNGNGTESRRARIPAMTSINIDSISLNATSVQYILDMKKGMFIQHHMGENWNVVLKTYAHRTKTRLLVTTIAIETNASLPTDLVVKLKVNHGNLSSDDLDLNNGTGNISSIYGHQKVPETPTSDRVPVFMYYSIADDNITVPANSRAQIVTRLYHASLSPFEAEANECYEQGIEMFINETLEKTHIEGWRTVWESGCIDLEGNATLASSVYSALYYILSAMPTVEETTWPFIGLSPEDLAHGNIPDIEYGGHIFWDQETWMYPAILALHSNLGKTLVGTRIRTLGAAYQYARQRGYKGAMYPWESAFVGLNVSPGGRWAKYEMHISGDIALAFKQYLMMTDDTDFLNKGRLHEAILGIAEFWESRATFNEAKGTYEILDVMPPDEWNYPVNNSVYTNAIARISLLLPKYACSLTGQTPPKHYETIADLMYIPFDEEKRYHPEFDGFFLNDTVKQADVVLLGYPLMVDTTEEVRSNDLNIYEKLTAEGPAMTWGMFAIGWLEIGDTGKAKEFFYRQLQNKREPFNVWTELADGDGATNFITGMGGFLQSVLFGYGGLRIHPDRIDFNCTPVPDTTSFTIRGLDYLGSSLNIHCTSASASVTLIKEGPVHLCLYLPGRSKSEKLSLQQTVTVPRQKFSVKRNTATKSAGVSPLLLCLAIFCKIMNFICLL